MTVHVALIGAGVVGLTTALQILDTTPDAQVTIIAESLPGDEKNTRYTSPWAGAHHLSVRGDDPWKREIELETFRIFWEASEPGEDGSEFFMRVRDVGYWSEEDITGKTQLEHMPDFTVIPKDELPSPYICGISCTTVTIDTARYPPYLLARFLAKGGRVRRAAVQHINQVLQGAWGIPVPDALVVCPGLGARLLGGVEDRDVYPIRGQTVLLRAPWVKESRKWEAAQHVSYIIPRSSGDVIVGGTFEPDDWYPHPRPATAQKILTHALTLMPELAPPHARTEGRTPSVADLEPLIIEHGCGLRPARRGGIRLERAEISVEGRVVPVVYNYGHGGAGYQASWGSARIAADLLAASALSGQAS